MKYLFTPLLVLLAVFVSLAQETCHTQWAIVSPDASSMYFISDRDGDGFQIYSSNLDGVGNIKKLTNLTGGCYYPELSYNGTKIVFQNNPYGADAEIYIMDTDGSNVTQLTNNDGYDGYPNFSPDGNTIVFAGWDSADYPEIFTMNVDGSNRVQLTNQEGAYWQSAPKFNPAGNKIYFQAGFNTDDRIVMMDTDGSNWVNITEPNAFGYQEANLFFNADGSKIAFMTTEKKGYQNGSDIAIANADGSELTYITSSEDGQTAFQACFHPTEDKLIYSYVETGTTQAIYSMKLDGTEAVKLTDCTVSVFGDNIRDLFGVKIYPNPVSAKLRIEQELSHTTPLSISIYNAIGKQVYIGSQQVMPQLTIDVQDWNSGMYFIRISDGENTLAKKVIVQH